MNTNSKLFYFSGFGSTIMIINGGIECGHGYEKPQATNRQNYYKNFAKYFKVIFFTTGHRLTSMIRPFSIVCTVYTVHHIMTY